MSAAPHTANDVIMRRSIRGERYPSLHERGEMRGGSDGIRGGFSILGRFLDNRHSVVTPFGIVAIARSRCAFIFRVDRETFANGTVDETFPPPHPSLDSPPRGSRARLRRRSRRFAPPQRTTEHFAPPSARDRKCRRGKWGLMNGRIDRLRWYRAFFRSLRRCRPPLTISVRTRTPSPRNSRARAFELVILNAPPSPMDESLIRIVCRAVPRRWVRGNFRRHRPWPSRILPEGEDSFCLT
jgi:hypothetical protein